MALVILVLGIVLLTASPGEAHVVLDGNTVQPLLVEITRDLREARDGSTEEARLEALYGLGERAQSLADLMNLDATSHGQSLYAELLVKRLEEYGIRIRRVGRNMRYAYDMAAFQDYLRRAPRGTHAADASFRLMAQAFYGSVGADPAVLVDIDVDQLRAAILREESFLKDYPSSDKVKNVRFFLAMDYYRLSRNSRDPATVREYKQRAARTLKQLVKEYPGTPEARAAESILER
ncbi:MAG TPA: hypothetical protein VKC64_03750 [Burkholderiales bacterium]|nr:hypothetical protein [Burkholderiales bacterium]